MEAALGNGLCDAATKYSTGHAHLMPVEIVSEFLF